MKLPKKMPFLNKKPTKTPEIIPISIFQCKARPVDFEFIVNVCEKINSFAKKNEIKL